MISNSLLKFAAAENWNLPDDESFVFGEKNNYLITAQTSEAITSFFIPIAGIAPEALLELTSSIERSNFALKLLNYELTDNFIAIRAKDTLLSTSAKRIGKFLDELTLLLAKLHVPTDACVICGQKADAKSLYIGMYCHIHPACVDQPGVDFTAAAKGKNAANLSELVILDKATKGTQSHAAEADSVDFEKSIERLATSMASYKDDFVKTLEALIAVPSIKGKATPDAPFGLETVNAMKVFLQAAEKLGFKTKNVDNKACYAEIGSGDEMVCAVCHLDVVPAGSGWTQDPFRLVVAGDKLTGRGVNDDKGPLVACLYALKALSSDPEFKPKRRIRLIAGLDEESGSACMEHYAAVEELPIAGFTADADFPAIYCEKGILRLKISLNRHGDEIISHACGGTAVNMVADTCSVSLNDGEVIKYAGETAHGSTPDKGVNAIAKAMMVLRKSRHLNDPFLSFFEKYLAFETDGNKLGLAFLDSTGKTTVNIGLVNINKDVAELTLDVRYPASFAVDDKISALRARLAEDGATLTVESDTEPLCIDENSSLISSLMQVYNEKFNTSEKALAIGGGTYARDLPNICAYGPCFPGDPDVAHQANESASLKRLLAAAAIYRDALKELATLEQID